MTAALLSRSWRLACAALAGQSLAATVTLAQGARRVTEIVVSPPEARLAVSQRLTFYAVGYDHSGSPVTAARFDWNSSNPAVATIDAAGVALAVSPGTATITARTGRGASAVSAQVQVTVPGNSGAPAPPAPVVEPQRSNPAAPVPIPAALAPTEAPAARSEPAPVVGTAALARQPAGTGVPDVLILTPVSNVLLPGERRQLQYRFVRADGENASPQPLLFLLDEGGERVARVDSTGLLVAGNNTGRTIVRAVRPGDGRFERRANVEVRADTARFDLDSTRLALGATDTLRVVVPAEDGRSLPADARVYVFASSDTAVATVLPQVPIVRGRRPGTAIITGESPHQPHPLRIQVVVFDPNAPPPAPARAAPAPGPVVATPAPAAAAPPRLVRPVADGDLIVAARRFGRWDLYVLTLPGDSPRITPLTQDSLIESDPVWSRDGGRVAFIARGTERGPADLWVIESGGQRRRLTDDSALVAWPSLVGPAGDRIVFESNRGGKSQLYIIGADGTGRHQLTLGDAPSRMPAASSDGRHVVFVSRLGGADDLFELDLASGDLQRLSNDPRPERQPAYGPEGRVYFLRDEGTARRLYRLAPASGTEMSLTPPTVSVERFSVGADGRIALVITDGDKSVLGIVGASGQFEPVRIPHGDAVAGAVFGPARH